LLLVSFAKAPVEGFEIELEFAQALRLKSTYLENEYLRLMILTKIDGRIHVGYDKKTGYAVTRGQSGTTNCSSLNP